jgi:hypothetical protein
MTEITLRRPWRSVQQRPDRFAGCLGTHKANDELTTEIKRRDSEGLNAEPVREFRKLLKRFRVLRNISCANSKPRLAALKILQKPFRRCAVRTTRADKNFHLGTGCGSHSQCRKAECPIEKNQPTHPLCHKLDPLRRS